MEAGEGEEGTLADGTFALLKQESKQQIPRTNLMITNCQALLYKYVHKLYYDP